MGFGCGQLQDNQPRCQTAFLDWVVWGLGCISYENGLVGCFIGNFFGDDQWLWAIICWLVDT
jgi:hypothetical protein